MDPNSCLAAAQIVNPSETKEACLRGCRHDICRPLRISQGLQPVQVQPLGLPEQGRRLRHRSLRPSQWPISGVHPATIHSQREAPPPIFQFSPLWSRMPERTAGAGTPGPPRSMTRPPSKTLRRGGACPAHCTPPMDLCASHQISRLLGSPLTERSPWRDPCLNWTRSSTMATSAFQRYYCLQIDNILMCFLSLHLSPGTANENSVPIHYCAGDEHFSACSTSL